MRLGIIFILGFFLFLFSACFREKKINNNENSIRLMQSYIDSSETLYNQAIMDLEKGVDRETLLLKYENNILFFHQKISKIFDSFTLEYMEKKISPEEYNNIMNSLNLDSVNSKKEELSKLGVNFDLKSKK